MAVLLHFQYRMVTTARGYSTMINSTSIVLFRYGGWLLAASARCVYAVGGGFAGLLVLVVVSHGVGGWGTCSRYQQNPTLINQKIIVQIGTMWTKEKNKGRNWLHVLNICGFDSSLCINEFSCKTGLHVTGSSSWRNRAPCSTTTNPHPPGYKKDR